MKKQNYADDNNKPTTNDKKHYGGYFKVPLHEMWHL